MQTGVQSGYINKIVSVDELEMYSYSQECQFRGMWNEYTKMARGLILDPVSKKIVARPFKKFFNYGEHNYNVPSEPFQVFEKVDGSLGIVFYHKGWRVATKGSFASEQAIWAEKWLYNNVDVNLLSKDYTYLFEIVYPENKIVVKYPYEGLVLLAVIETESGYEFPYDSVASMANKIETKICKHLAFEGKTPNDIWIYAKTLPATEEGFVLRFVSGLRVKMKGDEYIRIHRIRSSFSPLSIWDAMRKNMDMDKIKKDMPEEFWPDLDYFASTFNNRAALLLQEIKNTANRYKDLSDKQLGLMKKTEMEELLTPFVFSVRKRDFLNQVEKQSKARDSLFELFRPTGNIIQE